MSMRTPPRRRKRSASPPKTSIRGRHDQSNQRAETASRAGAFILLAIEYCSALGLAAAALPTTHLPSDNGSYGRAAFVFTILVSLWSAISTCACSKQAIVAGVLFGWRLQPATRFGFASSPAWDVMVAWLLGSLGFTAAIGAASIRIPRSSFACERVALRYVSSALGAAAELGWTDTAASHSSKLGATSLVAWIQSCVARVWCIVCVIAVEAAMVPGAALSVVATAALTAIGGTFDHASLQADDGAHQEHDGAAPDTGDAAPLIVLVHGHKFNAAMWGRYVVSFALARRPSVAVNYEVEGRLLNSAAHDQGLAELAAVMARDLEAKQIVASRAHRSGASRGRGAKRRGGKLGSGVDGGRGDDGRAALSIGLRPVVLVGHSLGGLVAAHFASHGAAEKLGLEVRGVIGISTPFDGVHALRYLRPLLPLLPTIMQPPRFVLDMFPGSAACTELKEAVRRHAARGRCSYRTICGSCDPVVRSASAFALHEPSPSLAATDDEARMRRHAGSGMASGHSLLLANEGHFTITMSDRLISTVVAWTADCLGS